MAIKRAAERDLRIPRIAEPNRRADCLADIYQFMPTYFGSIFYQPFTSDRREMIDAIIHAARYVGDQAVAGPRADGKTRSALYCSLALMLAMRLMLPVIISKSGVRANRELKDFKHAIVNSPLLLADFPEVVYPIVALGGWSSKARQQTAFGHPTQLEWGEDCIIFPSIPSEVLWTNGWNEGVPSAAGEQAMASLGIEGPIRGFTVRSRRPDLAILDDVDDRESARSEMQTDTREHIIEEDIGGLAGPDRTVSRVMLCTLINRTCIAARFTDRTIKQSWKGQRHRLLDQEPERMDLWDEYISRRQNRTEADPDARDATRFYIEHKEAMDAGASVTNPHRYDSRPLADGQPAELSALQACFNLIADRGREHFDTEYQNSPPEESGPIESGITPHRIQKQVNGYPRRTLPPEVVKLTRGIDCRKTALHWAVRAWRKDGSGFTIDYGVYEIHGTTYGSDEGVDVKLKRAILDYLDESKNSYERPIDRTLIDAGWKTEAVYSACRTAGLGVSPVMGFGKSNGCVQANFYDVQRTTTDKRPGDHWFLSRKGKIWLVCAEVDHWKAWEHDRWMTAPGRPGCMTIFGEPSQNNERLSTDERDHHSYARHICNEIEIEEPHKGAMRRRWKSKSDNTHWLDASVYADVAANMEGITLFSAPKDEQKAGWFAAQKRPKSKTRAGA